jgi:ABC-type transporter Mla subunit MlaD
MSDEEDIEELKAQTQKGRRTDAAANEHQGELSEDIQEQLQAIDSGDRKTLAIRDESLAALFGALVERDDDLDAAVEKLADAAGREVDDSTKSELLRLAARVGLQEAAPELWDELLEAKKARAVERA